MKNKILILASFTLLIVSCLGYEDPERDRFGFDFTIANNTNIEYTNASITIGGMKDGKFIGTESYDFPTLKVIGFQEWNTYGDNVQLINYTIERWNPNLDLIRNIPSDSLYFKLTLAEGNVTLLRNVNLDEGTLTTLISREIHKGYEIKNDDGNLFIAIWEEGIIAHLHED